MAKVVAALTMSLDGFIAGLGDHALGVGVQVSDFQGLDAERASGRYNFRRLRSFYDNREWYSKKVFSARTLSGSLLSARLLPLPPSDSPDGPDETMMAPVTALARHMAHPDGAVFPPVFADDGLVIVENFPPYIFNGKDAAEHCAAGYRKHV
jgi:hypothetical protein